MALSFVTVAATTRTRLEQPAPSAPASTLRALERQHAPRPSRFRTTLAPWAARMLRHPSRGPSNVADGA